MTGYFNRLVQRFGVAPAPPGRRVSPAEAQHPLEQEEWRETAAPLRDAPESAAPRPGAVPAEAAEPADAFPRLVIGPQPSAVESSLGPSITPMLVTEVVPATESAPAAGRAHVTPSAERSVIEADAVEEAPLRPRVGAGPSLDSRPPRRSTAAPAAERLRSGTAMSPNAPAVAIPSAQEPPSHRVQPLEALSPAPPLAAVRARPQEEPAARAASSSHAPASGTRVDDRRSPIEVRIGTVTLELRGSPPPAPPARPAAAAERRESARFSSSRYHLRWE